MFWIQICNPNLCKFHIFWITANIENWPFFAYLMTQIDEIGKIVPKFFHRVIFAFWIQICNPNLCKSHTFWNTANIEKLAFFRIRGPDYQNWWNRKNCPKFFHRVIFAFWIPIFNPNLCKSHTFWNTANIENCPFFAYPDLMTKIDETRKIVKKFFHRVIFAFWIQICNPNLCKSHTFWNTANIENCPFFAYADLMTKIDVIGKIARNSFVG